MKKKTDYYSLAVMDNIEKCKVDPDYLGEVIIANENLIWYSIHKYIGNPNMLVKNNHLEKDDILQLGRIGFIKAIKAFDTTRGIKFSSFAVTAIVREVRCFLRDCGSIIRPTRTANELIYKISKIENEFGYTPCVSDLVDLLGESEEKIIKALQAGKPVKYLEETMSKNNNASLTLLNLLENNYCENIEDDILNKLQIEGLIKRLEPELSKVEINVLKLRINGHTQTETAKKQNISQMRVSRIMKKIANMIDKSPELQDFIKTA